jgi:hypothetical protein
MHFILTCLCVSSAAIFLPCPRNFKLKNGHNHVQFFKCDQRARVPEDLLVAYLEFSVTLLLVTIGL